MLFKIIFTWWNKFTFGTFLKTLLFGKYVGSDEFGNKYYKSKKNERWVIYADSIEATKISSNGIYGYTIQLIKSLIKIFKNLNGKKNI